MDKTNIRIVGEILVRVTGLSALDKAIHMTRHSKLITTLRTAVENGEGMLDKEATSHDDLFDSFRLSLKGSKS